MIKTSTKNLEKLTQPSIEKLFLPKVSDTDLDIFYAGISSHLDKLSREPKPEIIDKLLFLSKNLR